MKDSQKILLSPLFLFSLFLLLINDLFLKDYFHNFLTGKLSDFAGLFGFAIFWTAFFPKGKILIYSLLVAIFTFWKSPFSSGFIEFWNSFGLFVIDRTVDFTDLTAFLVLPLAWIYGEKAKPLAMPKISQNFAFTTIVLISVFAFTATSYKEDRNVHYNKKFVFKGSQDEFISKLKRINSISDIDVTNQKEHFANAPIGSSIPPNEYFYTFKLNKAVCESEDIRIYAFVRAENDMTYLENISVNFWCKQRPDQEIENQVFEVIEREIIAPVGMTVFESNTETKNKND